MTLDLLFWFFVVLLGVATINKDYGSAATFFVLSAITFVLM